MFKLFTKKWTFSFLSSLVITFVAGFFIWNAFISPDNSVLDQVLNKVDKIGSRFFTASLSVDYVPDNIIPEESSSKVKASEQSVTDIAGPVATVLSAGESLQDQLDNIQEKLDVISQQVQELVAQQNPQNQLKEENKPIEDKNIQDQTDNQDNSQDTGNENTNNAVQTSVVATVYPKILISEIQVAGLSDDKQEFIELYNPNNVSVDLTDWYLQRKTAGSSDWSTYASNNLFVGKILSSNNYFLIARTGYYPGSADIFTDSPITDSNSFAIKNPNGEISDKLGFGSAIDYESSPAQNPGAGQSIGRRLSNGTEQDSDNNSADFELQNLTPKANNTALSSPLVQGGGGSGGMVPVAYPKILISEVKIADKPADKNIFIELDNPNSTEVDLTNWYIFRNDSSFITKTMMAGKKIPPASYFLLTKEGSTWDEKSDLLFDGTLNDNDKISLKNPDGDVADETSWAKVAEGLSLGRKWDAIKQIYSDTDDNSADFELDTLTPKEQNVAYVPTLIIPTLTGIEITSPAAKLIYNVGEELDIYGLAVTGTYSDGNKQLETITSDNITGFDSSAPADKQVLTITFNDQTATYTIDIKAVSDTAPLSITVYTISDLVISPNGDGVKDSAQIDWKFSEPVKVNVDILSSDGKTAVKNFYKSNKVTDPQIKTWEGKDSSDKILPDGIYTIEIVITDSDKNSITDTSRTITIDTVAPIITLNGDPIINLIVGSEYAELEATTDDGSIVTIAGSVDTTTAGSYNVIYTASDSAGNQATQVVRTVIVGEDPNPDPQLTAD